MNTFDWSRVIVGSLIGIILPACNSARVADSSAPSVPPALNATDARAFTGTIVSFRPLTSTMLISKDEYHGSDKFPNIIQVKYDADTQFRVDHRPATLDQIRQYMNVAVAGHMQNGHMVVETADFSSVLPQNVHSAEASNR